MQRRSFLKRGLLGGVLLVVAAGGGVALLPGDKSVKPSGPLSSLPESAFPVLAAVAARALAGTTASPVEIAMRVDAALRYARPEVRKDLGDALALLENALGGLLTRGTARPFTQLDEKEQDEALHRWRDSRLVLLRSAYHGLRKLCLAAHYATPAGWPETGYPGPSIPKPEPPAITARGALAVATVDPELPDGVAPDGVAPRTP
jgi:hypothetical protein